MTRAILVGTAVRAAGVAAILAWGPAGLLVACLLHGAACTWSA